MKNKVLFAWIGITISFILAISSVGAMGVSPPRVDIDFHPNTVQTIDFYIFHAAEDRKVIVNVEGELGKYVTLNKNEFYGEGKLRVTINFPSNIETPGGNVIYITIAEEPAQNQFIGTAITIRAGIVVHVPYPGKYIEYGLNVPNGNVDSKIPIELQVINRGTESLTIDPVITFYDSVMKEMHQMTFNPISLNTNEYDYFRRYLDTTGWKQGNYFAEAIIDYSGEKKSINATFKVGNLFVNVTDFTTNISEGEINKFLIKTKSNWNEDLTGIYADVTIFNDTTRASFRTPQIELKAWGEKTIESYFDATGIAPGEYNVEVKLSYSGQNTFAFGKLMVIAKPVGMMKRIIYISVIVLLVAAALAASYVIARRFKKKKGKKARRRRQKQE